MIEVNDDREIFMSRRKEKKIMEEEHQSGDTFNKVPSKWVVVWSEGRADDHVTNTVSICMFADRSTLLHSFHPKYSRSGRTNEQKENDEDPLVSQLTSTQLKQKDSQTSSSWQYLQVEPLLIFLDSRLGGKPMLFHMHCQEAPSMHAQRRH